MINKNNSKLILHSSTDKPLYVNVKGITNFTLNLTTIQAIQNDNGLFHIHLCKIHCNI